MNYYRNKCTDDVTLTTTSIMRALGLSRYKSLWCIIVLNLFLAHICQSYHFSVKHNALRTHNSLFEASMLNINRLTYNLTVNVMINYQHFNVITIMKWKHVLTFWYLFFDFEVCGRALREIVPCYDDLDYSL